mgnify:CR=1 FL=1
MVINMKQNIDYFEYPELQPKNLRLIFEENLDEEGLIIGDDPEATFSKMFKSAAELGYSFECGADFIPSNLRKINDESVNYSVEVVELKCTSDNPSHDFFTESDYCIEPFIEIGGQFRIRNNKNEDMIIKKEDLTEFERKEIRFEYIKDGAMYAVHLINHSFQEDKDASTIAANDFSFVI